MEGEQGEESLVCHTDQSADLSGLWFGTTVATIHNSGSRRENSGAYPPTMESGGSENDKKVNEHGSVHSNTADEEIASMTHEAVITLTQRGMESVYMHATAENGLESMKMETSVALIQRWWRQWLSAMEPDFFYDTNEGEPDRMMNDEAIRPLIAEVEVVDVVMGDSDDAFQNDRALFSCGRNNC